MHRLMKVTSVLPSGIILLRNSKINHSFYSLPRKRKNPKRRFRDHLEIMAGMLTALSRNVFSIRSDIIRNFHSTTNNSQVRRYLGHMLKHDFIQVLDYGEHYTYSYGKMKFKDAKMQALYLRSHKVFRRKSNKLIVVTDKGFRFLDIYNQIARLLVLQ